jgi:anti-anti-sigma factor
VCARSLPTAAVDRRVSKVPSFSSPEFGVVTSAAGFEAVLTVTGEVDGNTAPVLGAALNSAIDGGHRFVVLDLAHSTFSDSSGVQVITRGMERLGLSGGALTIRSPSTVVRRLLDVAVLSELLRFEYSDTSADLGPEQPVELNDAPAESLGIPEPMKLNAAIPSHHELIDGALRLVVALARLTVGGADGVSVSLQRHGRLETVAASDQTILTMDAHQYATGEGPCVDASIEGRWFHIAELGAESRWPNFTPRAKALGINAILSSPLLANEKPVGALNIYSRTVTAFAPEDQQLAAAFASEASNVLTDAGVDVTDAQLDTRFHSALRTREVISQAQGIIMERTGMGEDDAYIVLRRLSLENGRPLRERAEEIVESASQLWIESGPQSRETGHA